MKRKRFTEEQIIGVLMSAGEQGGRRTLWCQCGQHEPLAGT